MDEEYLLELEKLKKENFELKKELKKYTSVDNNFIRDNLDILIKPIESFDFKVRTYNCLKNEKIENLGDLIQLSEQYLLKTQNFGQKSLQELKDILKYYNLKFNTRIEEWPPENLDYKIKSFEKSAIEEIEVDEKSLLEEIENTLEKKEFHLIEERLKNSKTLNEIGLNLNLTRERVRQLEAKALRRLKVKLKIYFIKYLETKKDNIFEKYSDDGKYVSKEQLRKFLARENLPRMVSLRNNEDFLLKLSIQLSYKNMYDYFNQEFIEKENGWEKELEKI